VCLARVRALTVDANGGRDEHFLHVVLCVDEDVEQQGRAAGVHVDVPVDLLHALPHADGRSEVHDRIALQDEGLESAPALT
jgi:hypothetical protein